MQVSEDFVEHMPRSVVLCQPLDQLPVLDAIVDLLNPVLSSFDVCLYPSRLIFDDFCKDDFQEQHSMLDHEHHNDHFVSG